MYVCVCVQCGTVPVVDVGRGFPVDDNDSNDNQQLHRPEVWNGSRLPMASGACAAWAENLQRTDKAMAVTVTTAGVNVAARGQREGSEGSRRPVHADPRTVDSGPFKLSF